MKKFLIIFVTLLILIMSEYIISSQELPRLSEAEASIAMDDNHITYVIENRSSSSYLYGISKNGQVENCYLLHKSKTQGDITRLFYGENSLYFAVESYDAQSGKFEGYQIRRLNTADYTAEDVIAVSADQLSRLLDFTVDDKQVSLIGISSAGTIDGFKASSEDSKLSMIFSYQLKEGESLLDAAYDLDTVYALLQDGEVIAFSNESRQSFSPQEGASFTAMERADENILLYNCQDNELYLGETAVKWKEICQDNLLIKTAYASSADNLTVIGVDSLGKARLVSWYGGELHEADSLKVSFMARISFASIPILIDAVVVLAAAAFLGLLTLIYRRTWSISLKLTMISSFIVLIAASATSCLVYQEASYRLKNNRLELLSVIAGEKRELLSAFDLSTLEEDGFYESKTFETLLKELDKQEISINRNKTMSIDFALINQDGDGSFIAVSQDGSNKIPVVLGYDNNIVLLLNRAITSDGDTSEVYGTEAIIITPVITERNHHVYLMAASVTDLEQALQSLLYRCFFYGGLISAAIIVLLALVIRHFINPVRRLSQALEEIAGGNIAAAREKLKHDYNGKMWGAFQKICNMADKDNYSNSKIIGSYYRFVPREADRLFQRDSILDIQVGDSITLSGMIGIVSITNRDEIRRKTSDDEYMKFVNSCFEIISSENTKHNGSILSNDFNLSAIKLLFLEKAENAVDFGIHLFMHMGDAGGQSSHSPKAFLMLHLSSFLYGIAGTDEQAFPFMTSSEIELLSAYSENFKGSNTRMVITDNTLKKLGKEYSTRFLGFISINELVFKLHEVLDTCPDSERAAKKRMDSKFQEGIRLFYQNDFYLARNLFSAVIRECPEDGIARWYLFASEKFFNMGDQSKVTYHLFGINDFHN